MVVEVGDSVVLKCDDNELMKVVLASREEAGTKLQEIGSFIISEASPVGKNLIGKMPGTSFEIFIEGKKSIYEVLGVEKGGFQKVLVNDSWVVFSRGKIVFVGSREDAEVIFNQLTGVITELELKYICHGDFPEDAYLKGLIAHSLDEAEHEEKLKVTSFTRQAYRPRTLNTLKRDHKNPRNPRKNVVKCHTVD